MSTSSKLAKKIVAGAFTFEAIQEMRDVLADKRNNHLELSCFGKSDLGGSRPYNGNQAARLILPVMGAPGKGQPRRGLPPPTFPG